jgi:hypothetical protein
MLALRAAGLLVFVALLCSLPRAFTALIVPEMMC